MTANGIQVQTQRQPQHQHRRHLSQPKEHAQLWKDQQPTGVKPVTVRALLDRLQIIPVMMPVKFAATTTAWVRHVMWLLKRKHAQLKKVQANTGARTLHPPASLVMLSTWNAAKAARFAANTNVWKNSFSDLK